MRDTDAARGRAGARRQARAARYDALFAPWMLAATGILLSLAFLFQPLLSVKAALLCVFLTAALASGKRVSLATTLFVTLGILAANLLVPLGRVLWRAGPLIITEGALREGIDKALTFEGLVYISKATIRPGLRLPGRFGSIVARAFMYYDRIVEYRGKLRPATLFEDADSFMLAIWEEAGAAVASGPEARQRRGVCGFVIAGLAVVAAYGALVLGMTAR